MSAQYLQGERTAVHCVWHLLHNLVQDVCGATRRHVLPTACPWLPKWCPLAVYTCPPLRQQHVCASDTDHSWCLLPAGQEEAWPAGPSSAMLQRPSLQPWPSLDTRPQECAACTLSLTDVQAQHEVHPAHQAQQEQPPVPDGVGPEGKAVEAGRAEHQGDGQAGHVLGDAVEAHRMLGGGEPLVPDGAACSQEGRGGSEGAPPAANSRVPEPVYQGCLQGMLQERPESYQLQHV